MLTFLVKGRASKAGFTSAPSADRFASTSVALGGGIAIFMTLALSILSAAAIIKFVIAPGRLAGLTEAVNIEPEHFIAKFDQLIVLLLSVTMLFALGLWDDIKHLGPFLKLIVQFAAAIIAAAFADIRVEFFIDNLYITTVLSAFWIVLIINVFNFLDNMDGASAGIAVIACSILFVAAAIGGQVFVGGLALVFIGALLGFLLFNFPPAKIYAGDAGSLIIGFFVAVLTLKTTYYQQEYSRWYAVFMPLIVMAVPLYDFASVTMLRLKQGKSPFVGDTQHFSHRLQRRGLSVTQTVLTLYLATLCTSLGATFLYQVNVYGAVLIFLQTFMVLAIIAVLEASGNKDL